MVPPITSISGIEIYFSGKFVVLETSFGLRVRFNGDHHADVTIPSSYSGQLCGLCGKVISYNTTIINCNCNVVMLFSPIKHPACYYAFLSRV